MKIKLFHILNSKDALNILGAKSFDDGVTCYRLARNIKNLNIELDNFEKIRTELIKKYGEEKRDGEIEVRESNKNEYIKQLDAILQQEIDIDILLLNPSKIIGVSPFNLIPIDWMLNAEEEEV